MISAATDPLSDMADPQISESSFSEQLYTLCCVENTKWKTTGQERTIILHYRHKSAILMLFAGKYLLDKES